MVEWFEIVLVFDEERALEYHSIIGPIDLVMRSFDGAYMALHSDGPVTRFDLDADRRPNLIALRRKDETEWIAEMALHPDARIAKMRETEVKKDGDFHEDESAG